MSLNVACRAADSDKHEFDVAFLLFHKGKLYSAANDGKIKVWSLDLQKLGEVEAHICSVFCLAASDDTLYSCSNDGTVKMWDLDTLKAKGTLIEKKEAEFWRVACSAGCLFIGDDQGSISVYKDNKYYGQVNIAEPVKDMAIHGSMVFTVRDVDLVVTEIKLAGEKIRYGTKVDYMGRAPVALIGDKLFAFLTRDGKEIQLHENSLASRFKRITSVPHGSGRLINAMAGVKWENQELLFSGGWAKQIKLWRAENNNLSFESSVDVDIVVNAIALGETNQLYAGGSDGHIVRVDIV